MKLELVGLEAFTGHMPAELSGGMQKRAGIARAMALDPSILFLDEPSVRPRSDHRRRARRDDPPARREPRRHVRRSSRTTSAASSSIADRVILLDSARKGIIAEGDPRVLRDESDDPRVRAFFRREAEPVAA